MNTINCYKTISKYTHTDAVMDWYVITDGGLAYVATKSKRQGADLFQANGSMSLNLDFLSTKAQLYNTVEEAEIAAVQQLRNVVGRGWTHFKTVQLEETPTPATRDEGYYTPGCGDLQ